MSVVSDRAHCRVTAGHIDKARNKLGSRTRKPNLSGTSQRSSAAPLACECAMRPVRRRKTIAPRLSRPTGWNLFLPMSTPITVTMLLSLALWSMARAPSGFGCPAICGHGRSIPLAVFSPFRALWHSQASYSQCRADSSPAEGTYDRDA